MKFEPKTHIVGKVYDLTQENMNAMIAEIENLRSALINIHDGGCDCQIPICCDWYIDIAREALGKKEI